MIVDSLKNCNFYEGVHKSFPKVFEALRRISEGEIVDKIVIEEESVWINAPTVTTVTEGDKLYEAHREFIDIHYIISGAELFAVANIEGLETVREYDASGDYSLLSGAVECITLKAGDFCVVFPQDAHIPVYQKVGEDELIRVVAKVKIYMEDMCHEKN